MRYGEQKWTTIPEHIVIPSGMSHSVDWLPPASLILALRLPTIAMTFPATICVPGPDVTLCL